MAAAGVMMRFWSPLAAPAGRMPGVTSKRVRSDQRTQHRGFFRRADDAVDAEIARLQRFALHELGHVAV